MYFSNAKVDVVFALSEVHHFDDETFQEGRDVITAGTHHCLCTKDINDDAHNDSICKFYPLGMVNQAKWRLIMIYFLCLVPDVAKGGEHSHI